MKMEDNLKFFGNERQPKKLKTTSIFLEIEDNLKNFVNGRRPEFCFWNGRRPQTTPSRRKVKLGPGCNFIILATEGRKQNFKTLAQLL
jgi:hypothetical protein